MALGQTIDKVIGQTINKAIDQTIVFVIPRESSLLTYSPMY